MKLIIGPMLLSLAASMHEIKTPRATEGGQCQVPGQCTPPPAAYSRIIEGPAPGVQWNIDGGFCGAWSTQQTALSAGAYVSQDLVRKANRDQTGIAFNMHGNTKMGYEVVPSNVAYTAKHLKLAFEEWDYNAPKPQSKAYMAWLKKHLVQGHPIVWFPICKDDGGCPYKDSCPNGGAINHVEPMFAIFSNHPLNNTEVFDDDWILHGSDQDVQPYYRPLKSLPDSLKMDGNCADAIPGFQHNEAYPCFDEDVTYGVAVTGLAVEGSLRVSLNVDTHSEPNVRLRSSKAIPLHGTATVYGLTTGQNYTLYRFDSIDALPAGPPFAATADHSTTFIANTASYTYADPVSFASNSAVYYVAE